MTDISLKVNWVYANKAGERVHITQALMKEGDLNPVSFQDSTGMSYNPDGGIIQFPYENNLIEELFECHGLDTPDRINFYEQDYYVFSSFSSFSLKWKGIRFDTLEAAYHYEKFDAYGYRDKDNTDFKELANIRGLIRRANSAHEAFQIAHEYKDKRRVDWEDKEVRVRTMFMLVIEKVKQHEYVRTKLLKTYGRRLSENSWRDSFWGAGPDDKGLDVLGQIWMLVRDIAEQGLLHDINPSIYSLDLINCGTNVVVGDSSQDIHIKLPLKHNPDSSSGRTLLPYIHDTTGLKPLTSYPTTTMIKAPLPAGIEDTPEIRQKLNEFLQSLSLDNVVKNHLDNSTMAFKPPLPSQSDRTSFVDVGRFPVGSGDSS